MTARWRLGSRNPFTVYRVADGAHNVEHAREHFVTSFRREEDARLAVDAVNAAAVPRSPEAVDRVFRSLTAMRGEETIPLGVRGKIAELADQLGPACVELSSPVAEGDTVTTLAALAALPKGTWVRGADTAEAVKNGPGLAGGWYLPRVGRLANEELLLPAEITLLPTAPAQPTTPPSCDCPDTDGAEPAGSADDEWVDDPSRSDHPVYECNLDHWCAMCGDPAAHKVGEEAPTRVPDNTNDLMIAAGHNLTNWLCCLHFRSVIGDCGDRRTGDDRVNAPRDDPDRTRLPAGSAVGQRGAPTRDALVDAIEGALSGELTSAFQAGERHVPGVTAAWDTQHHARRGAERMADVALAVLRDGGADTGGERAVPTLTMVAPFADCGFCGAPLADLCAPLPDGTMACSARCVDLSRIARALGVSLDPDDPDPVGRLVEAAGKATEVEVVTTKQAIALPPGSWVLRCHHNGTPWLNASPRPADAIGSAGDPRWLVLYRAPAPAPAALAVGEVVESAADLSRRATVGTIVDDGARIGRCKITGWSVTGLVGLGTCQNLAYPVTVVRVGTGGGES